MNGINDACIARFEQLLKKTCQRQNVTEQNISLGSRWSDMSENIIHGVMQSNNKFSQIRSLIIFHDNGLQQQTQTRYSAHTA